MKKKESYLLLIVLVLFFFTSCSYFMAKSHSSAYKAQSELSQKFQKDYYGDKEVYTSTEENISVKQSAGEEKGLVSPVRKLIRTADLTIEVESIPLSVSKITKIVDEVGGYISHSTLSGEEQSQVADLTVRIPREHFQECLDRVSLIGKVKNKEVNAEDITEEYIDLEARLHNKKVEEARLLKILDKAFKVRDILEIENELSRVRGEIEQFEARKRLLSNQVEYSSINITLVPTIKISAPERFWDLGPTVAAAIKMLLTIIKVLIKIVIWLFFLLPFWCIPLLLIWYLWRKFKRWLIGISKRYFSEEDS